MHVTKSIEEECIQHIIGKRYDNEDIETFIKRFVKDDDEGKSDVALFFAPIYKHGINLKAYHSEIYYILEKIIPLTDVLVL